jgi:hypothetical protein
LAAVPGQQFLDPVDSVVRDAREDAGELRPGIDTAGFGGFDQGFGDGGGFAAGLRAQEEVVRLEPSGQASLVSGCC